MHRDTANPRILRANDHDLIRRGIRVLLPRFVAFLRAINVGGNRVVKMDFLRQVFESLGFSRVETFIASGNVVFDTGARNPKMLERKIEKNCGRF